MDKNEKLLEVVRETQKSPCVCYNLRKAARTMSQLYDATFKPYGIKGTQYTLLAIIASRQPIRLNDIAKMSYTEKSTIGKNISLLIKNGLAQYVQGKDKRERMVTLTTKGEKTLIDSYPQWKGIQDKVKKTIGDNNVEELLHQLSIALESASKV